MAHLYTQKIIKEFSDKRILDSISLSADKGEFVSILGESGSGKTTLLKIIAGLIRPQSGKVYLEQDDITNLVPQKREIAMVFQDLLLFPHLNVLENIEFSLKVKGVNCDRRKVAALELLDYVRLNGFERRYPHEISGGQKQRVAISRALISSPKALLLDEPFSSLDTNLRMEMSDFIKSIQRDRGITTIMVTHDREEAMRLSDKIAIINEGRIFESGTPEQVYKSPRTLYTARLMGEVNVIDSFMDNLFDCSHGCSMIIRPESIKISTNYNDGLIKGKVIDRIFSGSRVYYSVFCNNNILKACCATTESFYDIGQEVFLEIDRRDIKEVTQL
jgi:ABC-type Fe3+/spermidine/putrescine transport system ATPase subunit